MRGKGKPKTAAASLQDLPVEIIEHLLQFLDLHEICTLRTCGGLIADKASQGRFREYFRNKPLRLTAKSLKSANEFLELKGLGSLLENLILLSEVHDTTPVRDVDQPLVEDPKARAEQEEVADLLSRLLLKLKTNSSAGYLQSLRLDLIDDSDKTSGDFARRRCQVAGDGLRITVLALQASAISVKRIDLFSAVTHCGITFEQIGVLPDTSQLSASLEHTESFSLCLAWNSPEGDSRDFPVSNEDNVLDALRLGGDTVSQLLSFMEGLQELDLRWYCEQLNDEYGADVLEHFLFTPVILSITLATLKTCSLRGIYTTEKVLLEFLNTTSARRISLQEVHLLEGRFESIISTLTRAEDSFEYFHLEDLFEDYQDAWYGWYMMPVHFDVPGKSKIKYLSSAVGPNEVTRKGEDVTQKLTYSFGQGREVQTSTQRKWEARREELFGTLY